MSNRAEKSALVLAIAIMVALGFGIFYFISDVFIYLQQFNQDLILILVAILLGSFFIGFSIRRAARIHGERHLQIEMKAQCYAKFIQACSKMLNCHFEDTSAVKAAREALAAASEQLMLWASVEVIKQLVALQSSDKAWVEKTSITPSVLEPVIRAMRIDLGQHNIRLRQGDLCHIGFSTKDELK